MKQQQRLEVTPDDLYALLGQLTVENRLLRGMLARQRQEMERQAEAEEPATIG